MPLAIGVLASPLPIMAVVLLLLGDRPRATGSAFVGGWIVGLVSLGLFGIVVLSGTAIFGAQGAGSAVRVAKALLGIAILALAVMQWRDRPRDGATVELPKLMSSLTTFSPIKAFGIGATFAAIKPKNLVLTLAAATVISDAGMTVGKEALALGAFVVVATLGVAAPLLTSFALGSRSTTTLDRWGIWLTRYNAVVVTVVLSVIGLLLVASALQS